MTNQYGLYDYNDKIKNNKIKIIINNNNDVKIFDENRIIYFNKEYDIYQ